MNDLIYNSNGNMNEEVDENNSIHNSSSNLDEMNDELYDDVKENDEAT